MSSRQHFPVRLTQTQWKAVAEVAPELADRLKLDERNQRTIPLTPAELKAIKQKARQALREARTGAVRNSLRHVTDLAAQALDRSRDLGAIPAAQRVYQLKAIKQKAGRCRGQGAGMRPSSPPVKKTQRRPRSNV
jgi:hypothetical protein